MGYHAGMMRRGILATALALAILAAGCGSEADPPRTDLGKVPAPPATRGYILISIDTLRADHLGLYGYPHPTSPFLDSLARRATVFDEAYAQYPSTLVSHMSMFTGLHPREHGVLPPNSVLSPEVETLPEVFRRHGFRTAGFAEGGYVSGRFGFRRGFNVFISRGRTHNRPLEKTFGRASEFLAGLAPKDRFFLFLHTYAVHAPYDAPPEYVKPFWPGPPPPGAFPATGPALTRRNATGERPSPQVLAWLTALYDAGIRQTDEVLRRFFSDLERLGLADEVTVVITADHGEEFLDHGLFNHTQLYRETMRVPLLVLHPGRPSPVRHGGVVQLIDLAPTFYELAHVQPRRQPTGASLARLLGQPLPPRPGTAWSEALDGARAVYRGERRELESLLLFDPPVEDWLPRRALFDSGGGELELQARSYGEPRRLAVRQEGKTLADLALTPEWKLFRVAARPGRLLLEADGCAAPKEGKAGKHLQCPAFQVRGLRLTRVELYDVARDPRQLNDLFHTRPRAARTLLRDLLAFNPPPVARTTAPPLSPELEANLRALGYL